MDECRKQFEEWFDSELLKYKDDNDMLRALHRGYGNNLTGWQAAWNRRADPVPEIDCRKCANRGKINGLSQETYCEQCNHQGYRQDHFIAAPDVK